ncbi:site-2 protease family protein [Candidatus Parcubacteria bacterium]|nr:site-2 protease family protein [Candidatus Parcubacteria bacterium]
MTIIIFIVLLTALVLVHELGHFVSARQAGIRIEEFGLGLPPRLIGLQRHPGTGRLQFVAGFWAKRRPAATTVYSFNLLPIGGFVKIFGEDGTVERDPRSFASQTWWVRVRTILAGVVMNMALAIVLLAIGFAAGTPIAASDAANPQALTDIKIQIAFVAPNSPAAMAGLKAGDAIVELRSGHTVLEPKEIGDIQEFIRRFAGEPITFTSARGNAVSQRAITPRLNPPVGEGAVGIAMEKTGVERLPVLAALGKGATTAFALARDFAAALFDILTRLFTRGRVPTELAGPIGIAAVVRDASQLGFWYLLRLAAIISVNLAVINSLPIPALDGGRLLFLLIEKLKGSPVPRRAEQLAHSIGLAALLFAIVAVSILDVQRWRL